MFSPFKIAINGFFSHISGQTHLEHLIFGTGRPGESQNRCGTLFAKGLENWRRLAIGFHA